MSALLLRRSLAPLVHGLAWGLLALTLFWFQPMQGHLVLPPAFWVKQGVLLALWVAVFYGTARVGVPRLLLGGRGGWFALAVVGAVAGVLLVAYGLDRVLSLPELMRAAFRAAREAAEAAEAVGRRPHGPRPYRLDFISLLITLLVLGIATATTVVQHYQEQTRQRERLDQERTEAELAALKAQINPHFLLNTLNNIYSLTLLDGERARAALHRLSRMMRYVLYDTAAGPAQLSQEVAFIQDYIDLMRLRLTERVGITFEHPAPLHEARIAPMLLLPFVENAFKHGVAATAPSQIYIGLHQPTSRQLAIEVRNSRVPHAGADLAGSNGIGLLNTRRRLDLLYPGRYALQVTERDKHDEFVVQLSLMLE